MTDYSSTSVRRLGFYKSKAGLRWLLVLFVIGGVLLLYHNQLDWRAKAASLQNSLLSITTQTGKSPERRPPWIDTPEVFDIAWLGPTYLDVSAEPDRPLMLHPLLADAMDAFLARPILTHAQARLLNEAACPPHQLDAQVNSDQLGSDHDTWVAVGTDEIVEMREGALEYLERHSEAEGENALIGPGLGLDGEPIVQGSRGIVFAAGNHATVDRTIVCIKQMQKLGWQQGNIEVFHFEGEMTDEKQRKQLEDLGARPRMVATKKTPGQWKNFELKAEAILRSSFDEVLYLDSDNYPLSDISALFDSALFRDPQGGNTVFWPDLNRDHTDNAIHRLLGIPCHDAWELDSGQMLIAKSGNEGLNLAALYLAQYMAEEGDFWFSGGDKDTFRYAFLALGIPYTPAPRWLSLLGNPDPRGKFCGAAMLQYGLTAPRPGHADPNDTSHPEPLFVHANLLKHMSGVRAGGVFTQFRRLAPWQDDVRSEYPSGTALHSISGGGHERGGRGLCSDIFSINGAAAQVETMDTKTAFGGLMKDFEAEYFGHGIRPGVWR